MRKKLIVNKNRPINLDLRSMKFPCMAIASILHRISGVLLFILLPVILCLLQQSLHSEQSFQQTQLLLSSPIYKLIIWAFSSALFYHLFAGIRHMVMDLGWGEDVNVARKTSILVIFLAIIAIIFLGMWIW